MHANTLLGTFFDLTPDWLVIHDLQGKHVRVSSAYARAQNRPAETFVGHSDQELGLINPLAHLPVLDVQNHPSRSELLTELQVTLQGKDYAVCATRLILRDPDGAPWGTFSYAHEVTRERSMERELEQQHAFLRNILDSDPSLIFVKDREGRFTLVNQAMADLYHQEPEAMLGKTIREINPNAAEVERFEAQDREILKTHQRRQFPPYFVVGPDGQKRWLYTTKQPLYSQDQPLDYVLGVTSDLTHLRATEEALKTREEQYRQLWQEAHRKTRELTLLDRVQAAIANKLDLAMLYDAVVDAISDQLGYALVIMTVPEGDRVVRVAYRGYADLPLTVASEGSASGYTIRTRRPLLIQDVSTSSNYTAAMPGVTSCVSVPVFSGSRVLGALVIESEDRVLDNQDLSLMQRVAEQLGIAIENAELHERTKLDLTRAHALYQVSQTLHHTGSQETLLEQICQSVMQALPARWCLIYIMDFEQEQVEYAASTARDASPLPMISFPELMSGLTGWTLKQHRPTLSLKGQADEREGPQVQQHRSSNDIGSLIVAPLIYQGKPIGTLTALNNLDDPDFSEADVDWMMSIANQVAIALAQRKLINQIQHLAYHDPLTSLPNRLLFEEQLKQAIARAKRLDTKLALLFIDLDGFKNVNDTLGHHIGDLLLHTLSGRFKERTRESDSFARMGGDEFAMILNDLRDPADAVQVAQKFLDLLKMPFHINMHELFISASIGISVYPDNGTDVNTLLKHADTAMYRAKASGKNDIRSFTPELAEKARERLSLETDLRYAMQRQELQLYYQPIIDLQTLQTIGHEALLRWIHPERGFIPPDRFIPVAEESGLITALGAWVIHEACRQNAEWQRAGRRAVRVAVNISMIQFATSNFVDTVKSALHESGLGVEWLELEVTESVVMHDVKMVTERLTELRELGVRVSIDDFGTGYSSLKYLQELPIDTLKIDRSFVNTIQKDAQEAPLVKTIILMAQSLGLNVIAEGVETIFQQEYLQSLGCSEAQGYYFSRPLPASQL
ncbi:EAL domain-containing protein [Deinococcus roseus]|nr:EAL domain-containing protein [Deinococcus roseus]